MARISLLKIEIGMFLALTMNYVGAYVLTIVWSIYVLHYALIVIATSFLFGAVVVDFTKSTIYTSVSVVLSAAIAAGLLSAPSLMFGESETLSLVLFIMSRYFLIGLTLSIFGMLTGCFVGNMLLEKMEMLQGNKEDKHSPLSDT